MLKRFSCTRKGSVKKCYCSFFYVFAASHPKKRGGGINPICFNSTREGFSWVFKFIELYRRHKGRTVSKGSYQSKN